MHLKWKRAVSDISLNYSNTDKVDRYFSGGESLTFHAHDVLFEIFQKSSSARFTTFPASELFYQPMYQLSVTSWIRTLISTRRPPAEVAFTSDIKLKVHLNTLKQLNLSAKCQMVCLRPQRRLHVTCTGKPLHTEIIRKLLRCLPAICPNNISTEGLWSRQSADSCRQTDILFII